MRREWILLWVAGVCCTRPQDPSARVVDGGGVDASAPNVSVDDASVEDANDAAVEDAPADSATPTRFTPRHGAQEDDTTPPQGPTLVLDSGTSPSVFAQWMHTALFPNAEDRHGDLVVLTAYAHDGAPALLTHGFRSAQTLALDASATPADYAAAAAILARAEAVWFEGGDQAAYVRWQSTPVLAAVQGVYDRGGAVGGLSAGMIILGSAVNDALLTLSENLTSARLLADPFDAELHFSHDLLRFAPLAGTITDPHFRGAGRMGRLATFMARNVGDGAGFRGIGVDDGAALAIDRHGLGRRLGQNAVHVVHGGRPSRLAPATPLLYAGLRVLHLHTDDDWFDFNRDCGEGSVITLDVDGAAAPPYSVDPYTGGVRRSTCD